MKAFGSKRTYGDCIVVRCKGSGCKVHVKVTVKNRKLGRKVS